MKHYKSFERIYIGSSDIGSLTVRSVHDVAPLHFGKDGSYFAYVCFGEDIEIGEHYEHFFSGKTWLKIYDDTGLVYDEYQPVGEVDIYRAGEMGCIIHWHD